MPATYVLVLFESLEGPSWSRSYGSWISNYLCNQYWSPLKLGVWILLMYSIQHHVIKFVNDLRQFSQSTLVSSTNKTESVESGVKHYNPDPECLCEVVLVWFTYHDANFKKFHIVPGLTGLFFLPLSVG